MARRYGRLLKRTDIENKKLSISSRKEGSYYTMRWKENEQQHYKYLGSKENELVKAIQEREYLKRSLLELKETANQLTGFASHYREFDPVAVNNNLPKAYRLTDEHLNEVIGKDKARKWKEDALRYKREHEAKYGVPYPEERQNRTSDGTMVRSKSEVAIYNILLSMEIQFVYELPTEVCGRTVWPDFTIYCEPLDRLILWEHFGRLFEEKYRLRFAQAMDLYLKDGRVPCVDLLMSFDTMDGKLDTKAVTELVRCLVCGEPLAA
ncbi:MAG: hypothetical protein IJH91_09300 [Mogibacterium sp.]|nr:hypothetical protein [Mogibacterium sp.]